MRFLKAFAKNLGAAIGVCAAIVAAFVLLFSPIWIATYALDVSGDALGAIVVINALLVTVAAVTWAELS